MHVPRAEAQFTGNETTLDRWLTDPDNNKYFRLDNATERAAIIGYLRQFAEKR